MHRNSQCPLFPSKIRASLERHLKSDLNVSVSVWCGFSSRKLWKLKKVQFNGTNEVMLNSRVTRKQPCRCLIMCLMKNKILKWISLLKFLSFTKLGKCLQFVMFCCKELSLSTLRWCHCGCVGGVGLVYAVFIKKIAQSTFACH